MFEDETVRVSFPELGRWTPGRIEKAMPRIFRECISANQRRVREEAGQPADFVTDHVEQIERSE